MLAHARYVIQDAGGELPVKTAKPKKARKPAEAADGKSVVAKAEAKPTAKLESAPKRAVEPAKRPVEPVRPVETKKPVEAKKPAPVTPATSTSGNKLRVDRPEATEDHNKLSKAERKALRRQQQEDRGERYR